MHAQTHISGQISGQVPIQAGSFSDLSHSNGNSVPAQMQHLGGLHMGSDFEHTRQRMRDCIFQLIRRGKPTTPVTVSRMQDMSSRLEEVLYRNAPTKEDYLNMNTLEQRLQQFVVRNAPRGQQLAHSNSSSSVGTMMPTPGMTHRRNSNLTVSSSVGNSLLPVSISECNTGVVDTINTRRLLSAPNGSTAGVSFSASDGSISNGHQHSPANISMGSGGNGPVPSIGLQRAASQMMPTPGLSNANGNSEPFNSAGTKSTNLTKPQQTKQYPGGHNSRILHNLGGQMGSGLRSTLQQYGFPNDSPIGVLGSTVNNVQLVRSPVASEGHQTVSSYGCSPASNRPSTLHLDHQQHLMQSTLPNQMIHMTGDGYGSNASDLSGSVKLCGTRMPVGSTVNGQNLNQIVHSNFQTSDQSSTMAFQSHQASKFPQQELHQRSQLGQQQLIQHQTIHDGRDHNLLFKGDEHGQSRVNPSLGSQPIEEHELDSHGDFQYSNIAAQLQLSELQNHDQQTTIVEGHSRGSQLIWHPSGQEEFCSSLSQISRQQVENQQLELVDSQNNNGCTNAGGNSESVLQGQWCSQSQEKFQIQGESSQENHVQQEFRRRITGQDEAQLPHPSSNGPITSHTSASRLHSTPKASNSAAFGQENATTRNCMQQIRWLLFLQHARRCSAPEGKCVEVNCIRVQQLLKHTEGCSLDQCSYPRCRSSRILIAHFKKCRNPACPVCIPVRHYMQSNIKPRHCPPSDQDFKNSVDASQKVSDAEDAAQLAVSTSSLTVEPSKDLQSTVKRIKVEHSSPPVQNNERSSVQVPALSQPHASQDAQSQIYQQLDIPMNAKCEIAEVKQGSSVSINRETRLFNEIDKGSFEDAGIMMVDNESMFTTVPVGLVKQEDKKDIDSVKQQVDQEMTTVSAEQSSETKSGKPKIQGVSLTELFTPDEIRRHIIGLRQWVGQSKAKAERNQAMENSMSENSCQLCAVEKLAFEPPPIYCTSCGARIKRNAMYYTTGSGDTRSCFCSPCYNEPRGDAIQVEGKSLQKAKMEKKRNDEETEEWWVQCDKCEAWQHQICALFNGRRNEGGQAEYTCPNCYVSEVERGERKPLPQSAVLGAKDLPRTVLSDHIEQRLFRRLRQERQERARVQGKNFDEVPGAEALVVRVVSSVDKKLEVKQRFLEIFQEENYPTEFPYKSKVVLLFQKIEGVEVCLFGMYVQEFGSECMLPNQRRVYLSYLDSVKYFRPEIKTVTGEALRTFVYHEILIAYLEYCKKRGFTSCYIWACPPLKGEDYILYCHPEIQKTPKSDKLREWYLSMLRKASKENIVVELTNLYDHFFISTGECKAKVTAARLPYFDGDYWPGAAEDMINQLLQEEDGRKQQKRGKIKKIITKRALKAAGQTDLSLNASKDILLMQKLGETISPMKEDFIMVHLQHACSHCCHLMVSGTRWVCNQCKKFQLCDKCYEAEQKLEERDRHPINSRDKHWLNPVEVNDVPEDTKDKDDILESEFFDTRQAFLSLCQGNHYQYDTLRRAKHSSMMVLYHLHNPTAPAFVTTCNICHNDIETGQGWRCEICADYDICNSCYKRDGGVDHPHRLTNHPSLVDRDAQNKEARQLRVLQLRKMLDLLVHAASCSYSANCQYLNCRKVKALFRHGFTCKTRASRGCGLCKKMWYILQLHARTCKETECKVPRCEDLKEHMRRLQQQSESRRRAAVNEMMRQRAAEVAGNSG